MRPPAASTWERGEESANHQNGADLELQTRIALSTIRKKTPCVSVEMNRDGLKLELKSLRELGQFT